MICLARQRGLTTSWLLNGRPLIVPKPRRHVRHEASINKSGNTLPEHECSAHKQAYSLTVGRYSLLGLSKQTPAGTEVSYIYLNFKL